MGTTLSTVLVPVEAEVKQVLRIPDGVAMAAHLGVGWPAGMQRGADRPGNQPRTALPTP